MVVWMAKTLHEEQFEPSIQEPFTTDGGGCLWFTSSARTGECGGNGEQSVRLNRSFPKQKDVVRYLEVSPDASAVAVEYFDENGSNIPAPVMELDISSGNVRSQWT